MHIFRKCKIYKYIRLIKNASIIISSTFISQDYKLLCLDGTTAAPSAAAKCNWGTIPSHIVMTSATHDQDLRAEYKELLELLSADFGVSIELYKDYASFIEL